MQTEYQRDLRDHYLVLHGAQQLAADSYRIHMIQENSLRGFTECHTELVDEEIRYAYRITSMQSLEEIAAVKPVGLKTLQNLFSAAADALEELENFLLPQDGILLQPAFIFTDAGQQNFRFCYFPENTEAIADGMKALSEFLLPRLDEKDRKAVMLGFAFYQICASGEMTEAKLKDLLYSEMNDAEAVKTESADIRRGMITAESKPSAADVQTKQEMTGEEIRARILDDFFSDEEEAEAEQKEHAQRRLLWFMLMTAAALGTAALLVLSGWVQSGLGAGVLIEAAAVLLWKKRSIPAALRNRIRKKREKRKGDVPDWYEEVDASWQTYGERAEELERIEAESGNDARMPALPAHSGEILPDHTAEAYSAQKELYSVRTGGWRPDAGYEETIWLGEEAASGLPAHAWLEKADGRIPLTEKEHLIGKNTEVCDIKASSAAVSRMHARFDRQEHGYTVTDLRSRNGTFLNGILLEAGRAYDLQDGDSIRFADETCQYYCSFQYPGDGGVVQNRT